MREGRVPCYLIFRRTSSRRGSVRPAARCCRRAHLPEPHDALRGGGRQPVEIGDRRRRAPGDDVPLPLGPRHDDRARGRPAPAGRLAKDQNRIGPVAAHQPVHHVDRHRAKPRQRHDRLLVFAGLGEVHKLGLVELAALMQRVDRALRRPRSPRRVRCRIPCDTLASTRRIPPGSRASRPRAAAAARPRSLAAADRETDAAGCRAAGPTFSASSPSRSARLTSAEKRRSRKAWPV